MADAVDVIVAGAGVVGLAVARALAQQGLEVIVLEKNRRAGEETSSRNSGVIHSGIYYAKGSLKARLCVRGRELLYEYCSDRGIAHQRCGKIIVAGQAEVAALAGLREKAIANGVTDLVWLSESEVREREPQVACAAGLLSPSTGIVSVAELLTSLQGDLEARNGVAVFQSQITRVRATGEHFLITVESGEDSNEIACRWLVNSAGLHALNFLKLIDGYPSGRLRTPYYAKGNYFVCQGVRPFRHLIYPMPNEAGLGIHATLDLNGVTRFGPDVEWIDAPAYQVDQARSAAFYAAIRLYWPTIPSDSLHPDYAGVRPKLLGPGSPAADFEIEHAAAHGVRGLINLLGIESPGLTSSLAIGEHVANLMLKNH